MKPSKQPSPIRVVAGVATQDHQVLVAQRQPDTQFISWWEFPGGKVEQGETDQQALKREWREEFGVDIHVGAPIVETEFDYGDKVILLCSFWCDILDGPPMLHQHQAIYWSEPRRLDAGVFSGADRPLIKVLCERFNRVARSESADKADAILHNPSPAVMKKCGVEGGQ
ncbi:hypothetical protein BZG05_01030 [Salinivibrio kushneri]|uniref:(deoxy)nucleoside triphosphate pyrophosphohydrolase n=1 Tax=Salinivibrio kushneri TaxID=1908198 RepID=UPI0009890BA2|nr:(deoxy)nucleoside triphosphate pyrophosphohydrolase [Salinivibrio kushneri]OOE36889.1 hypothetical protein BZG05_01030 [Salinivibrio kushneri]